MREGKNNTPEERTYELMDVPFFQGEENGIG
jgi:hypothetical protein